MCPATGTTEPSAGTTWTTSGKYGNALTFNGTNALVTVNNATSLQLTTGMTLEAWVYPTTTTACYRDVIYKGDDNYYLEATSPQSGAPVTGGTFTSELFGTSALPVNTWSYLAATYDRSTLRLYVNGVQVASKSATAAMAVSSNPLQIGGNTIYGSYYNGVIDEVRIYNRALTQAQIQSDMNTPVGGTAPTPTPTATATPTPSATATFTPTPTATATFTPHRPRPRLQLLPLQLQLQQRQLLRLVRLQLHHRLLRHRHLHQLRRQQRHLRQRQRQQQQLQQLPRPLLRRLQHSVWWRPMDSMRETGRS